MTSRLDFGPEMLALFLQAHVMFAGVMAASKPFERRAVDASRVPAEREYILHLAATAGVRAPVALRAMRGDGRIYPSHRIALWRAMGIDPLIHERKPE